MRTVNAIIQAVQERQAATEDELRLSLLCVYYNSGLFMKKSPDALRARFNMLKADPEEYLGVNWTPPNYKKE